ncbi:unnamed protein product [Peronospora belbahrii]|uniref:Kinesin-like protein n=1 Tax=Peronospora belbahrii TaxID=622444 RepID=A0ABN8DB27_9STRA|nr:unnamed protein product [Peronospora belbahrii]
MQDHGVSASYSTFTTPLIDKRALKLESIQVAVRVRPLSSKERLQGSKTCVNVVNTSVVVAEKQFDFDAVFPSTMQQENVYTTLVKPLMNEFFDGYNVTVLAYGQTGSGKTYTMGNEFASSVSRTDRGIIPRVIDHIFERINANPQHFVVKMSYLEVSNEEIIDLLVKTFCCTNTSLPTNTGLSVRGDGDRGIFVSGLSEHVVNSASQARAFLCSGAQVRATASTSMNGRSSRSHAICTLSMEQHEASFVEEGAETRYSKFHLVDLAGSERVQRTNMEGARFKEGVSINRDLLALGNDSLGGNSKTLIIACISPANVNYEETCNTLRYAFRTRSIENRAMVNNESGIASNVASLKRQIRVVKLQHTVDKSVTENAYSSSSYTKTQLEEQNRKLKEELVHANCVKDRWKSIASALETKLEEVTKELHRLQTQAAKKKALKKRKTRESYETMETLFSSSSGEEDNSEGDSDYIDEDNNRNYKRKKRGNNTLAQTSLKQLDVMDEIDELLENSAVSCCTCHGKCATKSCACKSVSRVCSAESLCNSSKCRNGSSGTNTLAERA